MFTGLVESLAEVVEIVPEPPGVRLVIREPGIVAESKIGDSIALNGCCLTVVSIDGDQLAFQAGEETLSRTNLTEGRANQKQRTYQALLDAALGLSEAGQQPTLRDIANKAMVSRATAYRYFPSVDALIHEAYFGRAAVPLDTVLAFLAGTLACAFLPPLRRRLTSTRWRSNTI